MKPTRTYAEAKALADAAARRHQQRAEQTVDTERRRKWAESLLAQARAIRIAGTR